MTPKKAKALRGVRPNAGLEVAFRKRLLRLIDKMHASVMYWLTISYKASPPLATDELPARALQRQLRRLSKRWLASFNDAAQRLTVAFAQAAEARSSGAFRAILREAGFAVDFKMTPAMRDVLAATVQASVGLIKSIPEQYLGQVEGIVMRGVQTGGDIGGIVKSLEHSFGVTRRRASLIARDQNSKATAAFARVRQLEVGITQAQWVHSGGGHTQRPTHVKAGRDKAVYDVAKGWWDPAVKKYVWPGTEINCRCVARPIIAGYAGQ